jgi:hypothetical protein
MTDNTFNLSSLRLSQNFSEQLQVKKALLTIPVRKAHKQEFVRVHPSPEHQIETMILELKEDRESYLIDPSLWSELYQEATPKLILTAMNRQGVLFLWPIRLPGEDGKTDDWSASALAAAEMAYTHWIRMASNMNLGAYEVYEALGQLPEPYWPDLSFEEMLKIAFKGRYIDSLEHPVVKRLRGEL